MRRVLLWLPLFMFAAFLLAVTLKLRNPGDTNIESHLVGKPIPAFALAPALPGKPGLSSATLASGQPRLVNIFASWCVPCAAEAPQLMELSRRGVPIDAIAIKDRPDDVKAFLDRWGDPYQHIGADQKSSVQLALGSSGVPETFVVDGHGIIRHQHIGDIRPEHVPELLSAWQAAR